MKNQSKSTTIEDFLFTIPLFTGLPEEDLNIFLKTASMRDYKKGDYLHRQEDEADRLCIVKDGWVRLYRSNSDGEEGVAQLCTRGDILGERAVLPGRIKYFFSAQAIGDCCVVNIPAFAVRDRAACNSLIMNRLVLGLVEKIGRLHIENEHMALLSAPQRVACLLLRLSSHMKGKGGTFTFPYDKSLAAAHLGMKRETFSRALTRLKPLGVNAGGFEVTIKNFIALSEYCCMRCSLNTECNGARCMMACSGEAGMRSSIDRFMLCSPTNKS